MEAIASGRKFVSMNGITMLIPIMDLSGDWLMEAPGNKLARRQSGEFPLDISARYLRRHSPSPGR